MKKSILIFAVACFIGTFTASCTKDKRLAPDPQPIVTAVEDTLNMEVFYNDTTVNFSAADFTLTVVDITAGESSTVFVQTTVVSGVLASTSYTGNKIHLPRTAGVSRVYRIYIGGRTATSPYLGNTIHNTGAGVYPYFPNGYLDVEIKADGSLRSFPDKTPFYFDQLDTSGNLNVSATF